MEDILKAQVLWAASENGGTLLVKLSCFRHLLATDSRDKVYVLLGISEDVEPPLGEEGRKVLLETNYQKSTSQAYRDTQRAIMESTGNLGVLHSLKHRYSSS